MMKTGIGFAGMVLVLLFLPSIVSAAFFETQDGVKTYYEGHGKGDVILLVHGWMCSSKFWKANVPELAKEFRVVARRSGYTFILAAVCERPSAEGVRADRNEYGAVSPRRMEQSLPENHADGRGGRCKRVVHCGSGEICDDLHTRYVQRRQGAGGRCRLDHHRAPEDPAVDRAGDLFRYIHVPVKQVIINSSQTKERNIPWDKLLVVI